MLNSTNMADTDFQYIHEMANKPYSYVLAAIFFVTISIYATSRKRTVKYDFPFFGNEEGDPDAPKRRWMADALNLLKDGRSKYPDSIFQIWTTEGNQLVLPPRYVDELKMKQDTVLPSSLLEFMQAHHTTFGAIDRPPKARDVIKNELNRNMPNLFPGVKAEIDYSLPREFPQDLKEGTAVTLYPLILRLVFRVSGRAFAGPTLHQNDDYMMLNINYARNVFSAALEIRKYPAWIRRYAKYFVPEIRNMWAENAKAVSYIKPIIQERNDLEKYPNYEGPNDTLEWIRVKLSEKEKKDYEYQAISQLAIGAASIHTTSQLMANVLFDLAARPEYVPELREEIKSVLEKHDGEWTIESMSELRKLDSFIKESQRYNPTVISFQRRALQSTTLKDGTHIPKGALLLAPAAAVSHDPTVYDRPEDFDGLRFYKLRQLVDNENKFQFTSTSNTQLHFGSGRHACPGRWFASHEAKLMVAALITEYDLKTKEGVGRPKNILMQSMHSPDPKAQIMLKSRARVC